MTLDEINWHIKRCAQLEQKAIDERNLEKSYFWRSFFWMWTIKRYRLYKEKAGA